MDLSAQGLLNLALVKRAFAVVLLLGLSLGVADTADASAKGALGRRASQERRRRNHPYELSGKGRQHAAAAWKAYRNHQHMKNGLQYGDSVRNLDLSNLSADEIDTLLLAKGFHVEVTALRDVKGDPIVFDGKVVPIRIYTHADGGTVRVKPEGDPTSRFITQPHLVKSLRWPFDAPGDGFEHEGLKVSNNGAPLPRLPSETKVPHHRVGRGKYFDIWAGLAHTDLRVETSVEAPPAN